MPKWTDYTTKTEPADNDEVMVLDTAGKANKRLGLSALSDWIIGKIANKVFENLQTQNKTILGALNELNSNQSSISIKETIRYKGDDSIMNVTNIPSSTVYFRILMMDATHPVLSSSGGILVGYLLQPNYYRQMFYSSQVIASRTCYNGKWSDWQRI